VLKQLYMGLFVSFGAFVKIVNAQAVRQPHMKPEDGQIYFETEKQKQPV